MTKEKTFTLIVDAVREIPRNSPTTTSARPTPWTLGANSMNRAEIVMTVLEEMDLDIPWSTPRAAEPGRTRPAPQRPAAVKAG